MEERNDKAFAIKNKSLLNARMIIALVLVIVAVFSATVLANKLSSPDAYKHEIEQLDKRKDTAASMSVAAAVASAGVSVIPSDICTPIAQQMAEISKDLGLVTGAIVLEKYAMNLLGAAVFRWILPIALLIIAVCIATPQSSAFKAQCIAAASRVLFASLIIWASVPLGVRASDMIYTTYESTINEAIESAELANELTQQKSAGADSSDGGGLSLENISFEGFTDAVKNIPSSIAGAVGSAINSAGDRVAVLIAWAKVLLTQLTEGFAVLVVITCVVPALVPLLMFWLVKLLFQPSTLTLPALPASRVED